MGTYSMYSMTDGDINIQCEQIKLVIIQTLVKEGILSEEAAEEWCETHGVLVTAPSLFTRLRDKVSVEKTPRHFRVVSKP